MIQDLNDQFGNRVLIPHSYESKLVLRFNGLGDVSADAFAFDIGDRGNNAIFTGAGVIEDGPNAEVSFTIPNTAFTAKAQKKVFQVRYTKAATPEQIIYSGFIDIVDTVTPNP